MTNEETLIQAQITLIDILQNEVKEANQRTRMERTERLRVEADNRRMWEMLYGSDSNRNYREGSE